MSCWCVSLLRILVNVKSNQEVILAGNINVGVGSRRSDDARYQRGEHLTNELEDDAVIKQQAV